MSVWRAHFVLLLNITLVFGLAHSAQAAGMLPGAGAKDPYEVQAQKLDYFDKEQKLIYTGAVIASQGQTKVSGSKMTIFLDGAEPDGGRKNVRHIEMAGAVTVVQKDKIGVGDSATYDRGK